MGIQQNLLPPAGTTDGQGNFRFDLIPPGTFFLEIEAFPGQNLGITQRPLCDPLRVKPGEKLENLVFPVEAAEDRGSLAGQVVDASSGLPLERFSYKIPTVELSGPGSAVHGLIHADETLPPVSPYSEISGTHGAIFLERISAGAATLEISAEEGYFEFKGLKQGSYTLRITVWLKEEAPHSAQLTERFKVGVETGPRIRKNIDFTRNAALRGSFTAPDPNLS